MENEEKVETTEEVVKEEGQEGTEGQEQQQPDRSFENLKAENERKAREISELRGKMERAASGYNPNDLSTWDDRQLQAIRYAPDVAPQFKQQAEDILMDRRVDRKLSQERERERRESFEMKRMEEYPETFDTSHPMSARMAKIARELGLDNSPSGRYAAAKIAASEMKPKKVSAKELAEKEKERIAGIKAAKTSRDQGSTPQTKQPTYEEKLKRANTSEEAFMEVLKAKGGGTAKGVLIPLNRQ